MMYSWLDQKEYPFKSLFLPIRGFNMHYIDEGKGKPILFVHGTPSWSFDFRNVIKSLANTHRCIAIDHMGFGLSDKPVKYDYSTQNHSLNLSEFIERLNLHHVTLVVHDFGGPIGINALYQFPERFDKIIILNSWLWDSRNDPSYKRAVRILKNPLVPFLYKYFNFSPRIILPRTFGKVKLSRTLHQHYIHPFDHQDQRSGPLAFARSLIHDQEWFGSLWAQKEILTKKPVGIIWGLKDPVITKKYLNQFLIGLPEAIALILENCGHFPQEEEPYQVAEFIENF